MKMIIIDDDFEGALALKKNIETINSDIYVHAFENDIGIETLCDEIDPDIFLMDIQMPNINGIELCKRIKLHNKEVKVLMFTSFRIKENLLDSVDAGCDGLIYKSHTSNELVDMLNMVACGVQIFDENIIQIVKDIKLGHKNYELFAETEKSRLSERELSIVSLITLGKTNCEISKELYLSEGYVRNQLIEIRNKLNLRNSKELAVWGAKAGL